MTRPSSPSPAPPAHPRHVRVDNTPLGIASMFGSVLLFSIMNVVVKLLTDRFPITELTFFRSAFALLPVCVAIHMTSGFRNALRTARPVGHFTRTLIGLTTMVAMFWSFHLLPLGDAIALNFASPLFLTALSVPMLGERVGIHRWGAVLIGFGGVLVIAKPSGDMLNLGVLVALVGAFCNASAMITIRQLSKTEASNTIVFYFTFLSTILIAVTLPFAWVTPSPLEWAMLAGMGLLGGSAQLLMTRAYSLAPAAVVAPLTYSSLLVAVLFGWLLWGDVPSASTGIGSAIVMASGLYILHRETRRNATPSRPPPAGSD